jgi:two-component system, NtrC family, sensor kinase
MHPLLERQIRRYLGDGAAIPESFLNSVAMAYVQADADRKLVEQSLELMSKELTERNAELRVQLVEQRNLNKRLEEMQMQLLQSEKMASIGQLAAGVAHEINNPIGFVQSNLGSLDKYICDLFKILDTYMELEKSLPAEVLLKWQALTQLKQDLDIDYLREDTPNLLRESKDGISRVSKIIKDLKDFSHVDEVEWQWADLREGLNSTLNIVWNELKYKAEVIKEYNNIPAVECLASQMNQIFMNLLVNAAHAIETRGTIKLRTDMADGGVYVEIADNGKGMSAEVQKRIFEPFFTTKPIGKGTGLGLSLVYGIVQKHHGRIDVQSEVGRGTTFRVWIPAKRQPDAEQSASSEAGL